MLKIKQYLQDYFFRPTFQEGKPKKSDKHYRNVFAQKGTMATEERERFFNEAYGEILFDLFLTWVQSPATDTELREHIYRQSLAVGSVREKLISYETFGRNVAFLPLESEADNEEDDDGTNS